MRALRSCARFGVAAIARARAAILTADPFTDGKDGAKVHIASGFVCPAMIGHFERDAAGESDADTATDFCAYSALDGVYGTITLTPLNGAYDPKASLAPDFARAGTHRRQAGLARRR